MKPSDLSFTANRAKRVSRSSGAQRNTRTSVRGRARFVRGSKLSARRTPGQSQITHASSVPDPSLIKKAQADFAAAALEYAFGGSQGELESWRELLHDPDPKIRLNAHKFLTTMRDGTPRKAEPRNDSRPLQLIFGPASSDDQLPRWIANSPTDAKVLRPDGTLTDFPILTKD